jgi:hypothetical protein
LSARLETPKGVTTAAITGGEEEVRKQKPWAPVVGPMVIEWG